MSKVIWHILDFPSECFLIECLNTKAKVITAANQRGERSYKEPIRASRLPKARRKAKNFQAIGFTFEFDLVERVARVIWASQRAKRCKTNAFQVNFPKMVFLWYLPFSWFAVMITLILALDTQSKGFSNWNGSSE